MESDKIKGVVIITLPPPDNPSLGKSITAFTLSDDFPEPPRQSGAVLQEVQESNSNELTLQQNLPIQAPSNSNQQSISSSGGLFAGTPRKLVVLLGIALVAIYLSASNFPVTLLELRSSEKNDDGRPKSLLFPLYSKLGLGENNDFQLKLGRTASVNKDNPVTTFNIGLEVPMPGKLVSSTLKSEESAILPVGGNIYPDGLYYTYVTVGEPPRPYFLDIDTGSDLTWVQCDAPCTSCGKGSNPLYKPKRENVVSFKDSLCMEVQRNYDGDQCATCHQCDYEIQYADQSSSLGVLVKDEFNLVFSNGSLTKMNVTFGCAYDQQGLLLNSLSKTDGILGLSRAKVSLPSQLASHGIINNVLGHCLTDDAAGGGYMFLGDDFVPQWGMAWVPMLDSPSIDFYQTKIVRVNYGSMVEEYKELEREMCEKKLAPNLPYVKTLFLGWFEPLKQAIEKEQNTQRSKKQKAAFAPHIELLSADKMAVIVMYKMMGLLMVAQQDGCVQVVQAAVQIGGAIEQEVRIQSFLEKARSNQRTKIPADAQCLSKEKEILRKRVNGLIRRRRLKEVQKLLKKEEFKAWGRDTQAKLGSRLIELLIESAFIQPPVSQSADCPPDIRPAFWHRFKPVTKTPGQKIVKTYGVIECDPIVLAGLDRTAKHVLIPYIPMLVPPKKWKGYDKGGHLFLPSYVMRTHGSSRQQDAMKNISGKQMQKVFEALDMLGSTKWRVNRRVLSVVESIWAQGGNTAGLVDRKDVPIPEQPLGDLTEMQEWKWSVRKAKKINQELHSQRCDVELKLSVARKMRDEEGFYYPHNLDFRGRAYPMHPHLNHLSSDLCRGVLEFAEGRPLGKSGLHWLKIHLANLYAGGVEKLSYDRRLAFVDDHLDSIFDSASNPVNGNRWWLTAEDPFQCLAACINLSEALKSSSPHTVISHLPIHQDGSCNGLQHYAALGRDTFEAAAVNLVAGEKPADVYTEIAARVHNIMIRDGNKDPATNPNALLAKILIDQVDRKLVKQTVMTSVYGVTYVGAREQIKKRLEEKGLISDDRLLFRAACYAAKVTLAALGEIFEAARGIMSWLGDCAKVIAADNQPVRWTTPLGLPVVQPYYKSERHLIRTSLQVLALRREGNSVDVRKHRTAFPPNFVHSLDGSHMMLTALACRDAGLRFAGVHDSFWTHACDVDQMNVILRETFVELYNMPVLESLLEGFETTYPGLTFPSLPDRGDFDLREVLNSPYFFN